MNILSRAFDNYLRLRNSEMAQKRLNIDPLRCDGCGACESACALKHTNTDNPEKSRIHVIQGDNKARFFLPSTCQHCENPPCLAVCPENAIFRDPDLDGVMIDTKLCVGCQMCVSACPFGAMDFDEDRARAYKCDLCDGDPECVKVCDKKALTYVEDNQLNYSRLKESSGLYYNVVRRMAA